MEQIGQESQYCPEKSRSWQQNRAQERREGKRSSGGERRAGRGLRKDRLGRAQCSHASLRCTGWG